MVTISLACEQAPKLGIGRKEKSATGTSRARPGSERGRGLERKGGTGSLYFFLSPDRARRVPLADFSFRPVPHLGTCS